eukprot:GILK01011080.1.p1 GENE.GILK01011080.1~~GILK01011080.1.p1  ORF type:complete len:355 (+),score=24.60 GILK01011080.1:151-1215(+)
MQHATIESAIPGAGIPNATSVFSKDLWNFNLLVESLSLESLMFFSAIYAFARRRKRDANKGDEKGMGSDWVYNLFQSVAGSLSGIMVVSLLLGKSPWVLGSNTVIPLYVLAWFLVYMCPLDWFYSMYSLPAMLPIRMVVALLEGFYQANSMHFFCKEALTVHPRSIVAPLVSSILVGFLPALYSDVEKWSRVRHSMLGVTIASLPLHMSIFVSLYDYAMTHAFPPVLPVPLMSDTAVRLSSMLMLGLCYMAFELFGDFNPFHPLGKLCSTLLYWARTSHPIESAAVVADKAEHMAHQLVVEGHMLASPFGVPLASDDSLVAEEPRLVRRNVNPSEKRSRSKSRSRRSLRASQAP